MLATYKELHTLLVRRDFCPKVQHLDNEVYEIMVLYPYPFFVKNTLLLS